MIWIWLKIRIFKLFSWLNSVKFNSVSGLSFVLSKIYPYIWKQRLKLNRKNMKFTLSWEISMVIMLFLNGRKTNLSQFLKFLIKYLYVFSIETYESSVYYSCYFYLILNVLSSIWIDSEQCNRQMWSWVGFNQAKRLKTLIFGQM